VPATSGDAAYSVDFASSAGSTSTVPVVVRSLVPTTSGKGSFAGIRTGGAGRLGAPPRLFTYTCDVPPGMPALTVDTRLGTAPSTDRIGGVLVDPDGQTPSVTTNTSATGQASGIEQTVPRPTTGRWRLSIVLEGAPTNLSQTFTGTIGFTSPVAAAGNLPNGAKTLPQGKPATVPLTITSSGALPRNPGIDPRTSDVEQIPLTPLTATSGAVAPASATGTAELADERHRRRRLAHGGTARRDNLNRHGSARGSGVGDGLWSVVPQQIGPFGPAGAPKGSATLSASALTQGFDHTVTSPDTTDQFLVGTDPHAATAKYVTVPPHGSVTIGVIITPTASPGTVVRGTLNLVTPVSVAADLSFLLGGIVTTSGDVVASLPYGYVVGCD
jgi:hypothetical protein